MSEALKIFFVFIAKIAMQLIFILSVITIFWMLLFNNTNYQDRFLKQDNTYTPYFLEEGEKYSGGQLLFQGEVSNWDFKDKYGNEIDIENDKLYFVVDNENFILEVAI